MPAIRRNPDRIPRLLNKLEQVWRKYPDMRLGQLMVNIDPKFESICFVEEDARFEALIDIVLEKFDCNLSRFVETADRQHESLAIAEQTADETALARAREFGKEVLPE
jgi:hypothetical protein